VSRVSVEHLVAQGLRTPHAHDATVTSARSIGAPIARGTPRSIARASTLRALVPNVSAINARDVAAAVLVGGFAAGVFAIVHNARAELHPWLTTDSGGLAASVRF
jgi:hypothetical protein